MSASREKKKRFEERSDGTEKRQVRAREDFKAKKRKKWITGAVVIVAVALIIVAVVFNSNLFYTGVPALRVGSDSYTAADFNYEYFNTYYNTYTSIANTYGSYASMLLDTSKPLKDQQYSDTQTWQDYFESQAFDQLQQMTILNSMADKEGWQLSAEQKAEVDANIESLKTAAANQNYTDYRAYIRALYGKGITESRLRSLLEKSYRATYYSRYLNETWTNSYTDEQMDDYYDGVRDEYDLVTFMVYQVSGEADDEAGIDAETAMADARVVADEIASARDMTTFADAVYRFAPEDDKPLYEDEDSCLRYMVAPAGISNTEWRSWLTDQARVSGDTTVVEYSTGYYVLLFLERCGNDFRLANFRRITVEVAADENTGEMTDATRAAAQATVDDILAAFNEDPTEENCAALADQYGGAGDGGLMESVILGELDSRDVEDYVFAESTQVGAVETFYKDGTYTVVYPMEPGEQYNRYIAKNAMSEEQYTSTIETAKADFPVETLFAFRFTK